ncbi:MAG: class II fructose-bisphosphate aldolase [Ruminococcaceae bacterium]|nr:class II fructose-bisphosphate aldolase [Oscillospiraceae bacterium]
MLVSLKELMQDAEEKGYAVGAFNAVSFESLRAIIAAAEETGKGVILNHAEVHFPLMPLEVIAPVMVDMAKKAKVPVCVHLDHGQSLETCMKAIQLGFTSVMLDVSGEDYEENVKQTALMCRLAHSVGVTVEAELGHIFQSDIGVGEAGEQETLDSFESAEDVYTDPDLAKDFVERTGVDALAIAFGTAHGVYKIKPKLDLDRIKMIKEKINVPFVMHGGSGLTKEEFQTSIRNGIRKINYYTYMALAGGKAIKDFIESKGEGENVFYHDIPGIAMEAMKENVKEAINIFSLEV